MDESRGTKRQRMERVSEHSPLLASSSLALSAPSLLVRVPPLQSPQSAPTEPPLRRVASSKAGLSTPDCMSSPVSHLRFMTRDMQEEARRLHAAQYLRESREMHLQQRRLYLVLDLDETLVHSLRSSVRHIVGDPRGQAAPEASGIGQLPDSIGDTAEHKESNEHTEEKEVTLTVQNVQFEMQLRPGVHKFLNEMSSLFAVYLYTMGSKDYVQQALHYLDPQHVIFKPGQVPSFKRAQTCSHNTVYLALANRTGSCVESCAR